MPVTAKLSRLFYERLGEQIANELVEWFNSVDATYRADLREFNEMNFARFDARLEQRLSETNARIDALAGRLDGNIDALSARLDARIEGLNGRMDGLATKSDLHALKAELMKWMFVFWAGTALAGLLLR